MKIGDLLYNKDDNILGMVTERWNNPDAEFNNLSPRWIYRVVWYDGGWREAVARQQPVAPSVYYSESRYLIQYRQEYVSLRAGMRLRERRARDTIKP